MDSPMYSTSSQSSSLSRPRTKAAMKGYENLKVSIPTSGLDLHQALDRSPNANGCKLAALADIALSSDVPAAFSRSRFLGSDKLHSPKAAEASSVAASRSNLSSVEVGAKAEAKPPSKARKRAQSSMEHKLGFRERKKKQKATPKQQVKSAGKTVVSEPTKAAKAVTSVAKDIYDFEESHDSVENAIVPLSLARPSKSDAPKPEARSENNKTPAKKSSDENEDESSYSDRDDYYNFNSISGSASEEDDTGTMASEDQSSKSKSSSKAAVDSQKKCMIVGRIFKNAKKNSDVSGESKEKEPIKALPKQKLDEIFDNLRTNQIKSEASATKEAEQKKKPVTEKPKPIKEPTPAKEEKEEPKEDESKQKANSKSRKPREVANLEAELGMSMDQIKELIGVGMRKTQRRCATNRQNKFMETWSSDEYEEFHATKDVIALIQEAEMKAQRAKAKQSKQIADANASSEQTDGNPSESTKKSRAKAEEAPSSKTKRTTFSGVKSDDSDFDEHWNKSAKRAKIRNRRRTIASREDALLTEAPSEKARPKQKSGSPAPEVASKTERSDKEKREKKKDTAADATKPKTAPAGAKSKSGKPMPRRKRVASEMLYYWSSSSDDEFGRIEASELDDGEANENHLEQHGWIVGDSHKKLVTLLAHAKGKKIEDCGVKETAHKKK